MAEIAMKIAVLKQALATLGESVKDQAESVHYDAKRYAQFRDSLIHRFKYSMDLLWKVLKNYLEIRYGSIPTPAPKPVFKEAFTVGLISEAEARLFLEMVDARNTTSHAYHEEFADVLSKKIPAFYQLMEKLAAQLDEKEPPIA